MIMVHFTFPATDWLHLVSSNGRTQMFSDEINNTLLCQMVTEQMRDNAILDLVLVNNKDLLDEHVVEKQYK